MATYEEIHGKRVDVFDSDPTLNSSYEGQVWYDSASGALKTVVSFAAWSSSSPLSTSRYDPAGGGGTQTAAFIAGGAPPAAGMTTTEEYDGSGWSSGGALGTGRYMGAGCGSLTAGLVAGGYKNPSPTLEQSVVEEYNGSSWAEQTDLSTGRYMIRSLMGTQTAAVASTGMTHPGGPINALTPVPLN